MTRRHLRSLLLLSAALAFTNLAGCPAEDGGGVNLIDPTDRPPNAVVTVTPSTGVTPGAAVTLDASGSSDPDGDPLTFEWSQTGGAATALSSSGEAVVTFLAPLVVETSSVSFRVTVRDGRGGEASADVSLLVEVGSEFAGHSQSAAPYRDNLTPDEAYHLLRRAALGARPEEVDYAVARGLAATVDDLLTYKPIQPAYQALEDLYEDDIPKRWLIQLIEGPNPLHERMAMFWHDRFATSRRVLSGGDRNLAVLHYNMLRGYALGNYRQFLEALTLDPLMLIWLDGANSPKDSPNENYTREFWELFTLGRDVLYTEQDIREGARAFTGITLLRQSGRDARPIYDLLNHDETPKLIFPARAAAANHDYESVIDLTLAQPEAARYVARNLFVYFVHDHPTDAVVEELAQVFRDSGYDIPPLVRRILTSQAFFSAEARYNQVTTPVEHVVFVARTLDMHIFSEDSQGYVLDQLANDLAGSGMDLLNPPGVEGWKEDTGWLQDQWVINRVKALGRTMEYGPGRTELVPYHLLPATSTWNVRETRGAIVDAMARVFHLALTPAEREEYIAVLDQDGWRAFQLEDPKYQPYHVFQMIRLMAMDERVIGR